MTIGTVTKLQAFTAFVDMGDGRSINGLFNQLKAEGYPISRATLMRWKDAEEWDKRVPEVLAGREMEAEAAKLAATARQVLEEQGVVQDQSTTDVLAVDLDDDEPDFVPFDTHQKLESTLDALSAMTSAMALTVTRHVSRYAGNVSLELAEILLLSKATGEIAKATADVHKALNPAPVAPKGKAPIEGEAGPRQDHGPVDFDQLRAGFANPPRLQK
jgi:hypothetical protein